MMRVGRGYVVLVKTPAGDWHQPTAIVAFTKNGAIRKATRPTPEGNPFEHGTFKCVTSKEWAFEVTK